MRFSSTFMAPVLLAACSVAAQPMDQDKLRCMGSDNEAKIDGCTAVIASGSQSAATRAVAYNNRAAAYDAIGKHDLAISDASQAIAIDSGYASAYNERAWAYHGKGLDLEGLPDAERAVSLAPSDAYSVETRAEIFETIGRRAEAIADYRTALKLDPTLQPAKDGLARMKEPTTKRAS